MSLKIFTVIGWVITLVSVWLKYKLAQTKQDRLRREQAEKMALDLKKGLKSQYARAQERETKLVAIAGGLSDDDASQLLSRDLNTPNLSGTTRPKNAKGGS